MKKILLALLILFNLSIAEDSMLDKIKEGANKVWDVTKEYTIKGYEKTKELINNEDESDDNESIWDKTKEFGIKIWDKTKEYSKKGYDKAKELLSDDEK